MYLGVRTVTLPGWRQVYHPGIGTLTVPGMATDAARHFYRCEACGRETGGQLEQATEPFFCQCGKLIGVEKGGE